MSGCCREEDLYSDSSIIYVDGWAANVLLAMRTLESVGGSILMVSLLGSMIVVNQTAYPTCHDIIF